MSQHYPFRENKVNSGVQKIRKFGVTGSAKDRLLLTGTDRFSMATWTGSMQQMLIKRW